jgi:hypothetical protein
VLVLVACDVQHTAPSVAPPASASARPTLTAIALPADVVAVKSSGRIIAIEGSVFIVRVDRVNSGAQRAIDDAVVALRTDANTSVQLVTTRSDTGVTPMDLRGIAVGDPITFMFEPRSLSSDGSYLARVIGRF